MPSRWAGFLALSLFASTAWAARPFHVEDMQKLARVGGPRISLDGTPSLHGDAQRRRQEQIGHQRPGRRRMRRRAAPDDVCRHGVECGRPLVARADRSCLVA